MLDFKDKVAVITGAASGIGKAIAEKCLKEGMKVVLSDIEKSALIETENELKIISPDILSVVTDVSKESDIFSLSKIALDHFGKVDLLFNNAGVNKRTLLWEYTSQNIQWILNVNILGVLNGIRIFVPIMLKQKSECHIINTASIAGLTASPGNGVYNLTKHAVVSMSETLYYELEILKSLINVSVFCPGFVKTKINTAERNEPTEQLNQHNDLVSGKSLEAQVNGLIQHIEQIHIQGVSNGEDPEKIVELLFDGIRKKQLYIVADKGSEIDIEQRMRNILSQTNPTLQPK